MELTEVKTDELFTEFATPVTPYGSAAFNALNAHKADALRAFVLRDSKGKARLGTLLGLSDGADGAEWRLPFSAPFGEVLCRKPQTLETCVEFVRQLCVAVTGTIEVTLAPDVYDPVMLPRLKGAFAAAARSRYDDLNYHYDLTAYAEFRDGLSSAARKNYNRAVRAGFTYEQGVPLGRAYEIIRRNREEHGYPLAMSVAEVEATSRIVGVDTFMLSLRGTDVASAIVYRINSRIAQVIYWGDIAGYSSDRPMNLLAYHVMEHYRAAGLETVDIGPSSRRGVPDIGLCTFKEGLGCTLSPKPTFVL